MRKLLTMLALAAMVVLAGACGSPANGGSSAENPPEKGTPQKAERPTPLDTVQVAYKETAAERTARTSFEITAGQPVNPEASAQSYPAKMKGQGVMDFSGAASSMTVEMLGMGGFEMRQIGATAYVKMPEDFVVAQMPGAKPWMEVDLDALSERQYGMNAAQMQGGAAHDPTRQLEYLRGVRTTRYEAVVDLEKEAAGQGAEAREAHDEMAEKLGASRAPVEVWLDDKNRVRRYALEATVPVPEGADSPSVHGKDATMRTRMVAEYYDFGTPVDIQAPPPDETMDGSKLLAGEQPAAQ